MKIKKLLAITLSAAMVITSVVVPQGSSEVLAADSGTADYILEEALKLTFDGATDGSTYTEDENSFMLKGSASIVGNPDDSTDKVLAVNSGLASTDATSGADKDWFASAAGILSGNDFSGGIVVSMDVKPTVQKTDWNYLFCVGHGSGLNANGVTCDGTISYVDGTIGFIARHGDTYSAHFPSDGWQTGNNVGSLYNYFMLEANCNKWYNLTYIYTPDYVAIYVDGVLATKWTAGLPAAELLSNIGSTGVLVLGGGVDPTLEHFTGYIDDVTISVAKTAATSISLSSTEMSLAVGKSDNLKVTAVPSYANYDTEVTWESSAPDVATVADGVVTAVGAGTATITAKTAAGLTSSCVVTVVAEEKPVTSVTASADKTTLNLKESATITSTYEPTDATGNTNVSYRSSDESILKVDSVSGVVTAVGGGTATVTAAIGNVTDTVEFTVNDTVSVGNPDGTSAWWGDWTPAYKLEDGTMLEFELTDLKGGAAVWSNIAAVFTPVFTDGLSMPNGTAGYQEFAILRGDNCDLRNTYGATFDGGSADLASDQFIEMMASASATLTIARNGNDVTYCYAVQGDNGTTCTRTAKVTITDITDLYVFFTVDTSSYTISKVHTWKSDSYTANVTAPSCEEKGYTEYTCTEEGCERTLTTDWVASLGGHDFSGDILYYQNRSDAEAMNGNNTTVDLNNLSCTTTIYSAQRCENGGEIVVKEIIGNQHQGIGALNNANAPTADADGNVAYYGCADCSTKFADQEGSTVLGDVVVPKLIATPAASWWSGTQYLSCSFPKSGEAVEYLFTCTSTGDVSINAYDASNGIDVGTWGYVRTDVYEATNTETTARNFLLAGNTYSAVASNNNGTFSVVIKNLSTGEEVINVSGTLKDSFDVNTAKICFYPQTGSYLVTRVNTRTTTYDLSLTNDTATCTAAGTKTYGSADGSLVYETASAALGHNLTKHSEEAATCTTEGKKEYWTCANEEGVLYADEEATTTTTEEELVIPAAGHNYTAEFTWTEKEGGGYEASIALTCASDATHTDTIDSSSVSVTSEVTTPATYTAKGKTTYTATYGDYTDTKVVEDIDKLTDTQAPTASVALDEQNVWKELVSAIIFGIFRKEAQTVTIAAEDVEKEGDDGASGLSSVSYYVTSNNKLGETELAAVTDWTALTDFTGSATINLIEEQNAVVYVKAVDVSGNVAYVSSDGIVIDTTAPVIDGVDDGGVYCAEQIVTVTDDNLDTVTLDGEAVTLDDNGQFTINPADAAQTITATDKAGNATTVSVTINNGHTFGETEPEFTWTEVEDGTGYEAVAVFTCAYCQETTTVEATVELTGSTAACTDGGDSTYTATVSLNGSDPFTSTKTDEGKALGHLWVVNGYSEGTSCTVEGSVTYECSRCGEEKSGEGVKLPHTFESAASHVAKEAASCESAGHEEYWKCDVCGNVFSTKAGTDDVMTTLDDLAIPATGHNYDTVKFAWADDYTATAVVVCANDAAHTVALESEAVTVTSEVTALPTCLADGERTYTAKAVWNDEEFTATKTATEPAAGHSYELTVDWEAETAELNCKEGDSKITADKLECSIKQETVEATCEEAGSITYTASVVYDGVTYTAEKVEVIPAIGHSYKDVAFTWAVDNKSATAVLVCENDTAHTKEAEVVMTNKTTQEPTCTKKGVETYTATVTYDGNVYTEPKEVAVAELGHDYQPTVVEPTCAEGGYTTYTCSRCNDTYTADEKPATGIHTYDEGVVTKAATCTEPGILTKTCSVCKETKAEVLPAKGHSLAKTAAKAATYSAAGNTEYYYCSECKKYFSDAAGTKEITLASTVIAMKALAKTAAPTVASAAKGVKITWKKTDGASGYYVLRKTAKGQYVTVATIQNGGTVTYTDTKAANGTAYVYAVQAFCGKNVSTYTASKSVIYLKSPKLSKVTNKKGEKALVKYTKNTKAAGYQIQYCTKKSFKGAKKLTVKSAKKASATIKKLTKKKTYYVRVRAYKKSGKTTYYSTWSNVKTVKVKK